MGDLKTFFDKPIYPTTSDLSGDLAIGRGTDPNSEDGTAAEGKLINFWADEKQALSEHGRSKSESANSVSGLPPLPNRMVSHEEPPEMPTLKDRMPGTIDKK